MGEKTFAEVIFSLLVGYTDFVATAGLDLKRDLLCRGDVRLDFKNIDHTRCYTIGFRHPDFHPLSADPPGVWNIQEADLVSGTSVRYASDVGGLPIIPRQATYGREDIIRLAEAVGLQDVGLGGTGIRMADLERISRTSLEDAKAVVSGKTLPVRPPRGGRIRVCPLNYGFILRPFPKSGEHFVRIPPFAPDPPPDL